MKQVTELHLHDHYSPLDGLNTPAEYFARAKEIGMTHLAQTNHGTNAGHREFKREADKAGIVPILGQELYISPTDMYDRRAKAKRQDGTDVYNHIIGLSMNDTGLETLNRLSRKSWEEGFYHKNRIDSDLIFSDNEGMIFLSGCLGGMWAKAIERGEFDEAMALAYQYKEVLGDRFYIEVQGSNPAEINHGLLAIADKVGIAPVVTSDCHYARKEDLWVEEAFLILSTNPKRNPDIEMSKAQQMDFLERYNYIYPDRTMTFQDIEIFLRDRETHEDLFHKQGIYREDIYDNTNVVAARIEEYNMPTGLDLLPVTVDDPNATLRKMAFDGLKRLGKNEDQVYIDRIEHELEVINGKNFAPYFLVVEDAVRWAISQGIIVGPGRGSSCSSLVCYALNITRIDPIPNGLLFARFLDPERDDMVDVDTDFEKARRHEVKNYLTEKYGHTAAIATFNEIGGKTAITDAARALGINPGETMRAVKEMDPGGEDFFDYFINDAQSKAYAAKYPEVVQLARRLEGRIRGTGIHASGFVTSNRPIESVAPIQTGKDPNNPDGDRMPYIAVDMNEAADIGLVKLDILGLNTLSVVSDALRFIKEEKGIDIDPYEISLDDADVYAEMYKGNNVGVFQAEGAAMNKWLMSSKCEEFNDIVNGTAIARPGPMNTIGPLYKKRLEGGGFHVSNPKERKIVGDTLGFPIFQEQLMLYMAELAGMSWGDAARARRVVGKKKSDPESIALMAELEEKFIEGAGVEIGTQRARKLWKDFEKWSGYAFAKAHAIPYSLITYWTAWLKFHYPTEFLAASIKNTNDDTKIANFITEAKRLGVKIKLPHINHSDVGMKIYDGQLLLGLKNIKFISDKSATKIIASRPYESFEHVSRVAKAKNSGIGSRAIEAMDKVGALTFDDNPSSGIPEASVLYEYLSIPTIPDIDWVDKGRLRTLDEFDSTGAFAVMAIYRGKGKSGKGWMIAELLDETAGQGVFADPEMEMEPGRMYLFLIADNRIVRASEVGSEPSNSPLEQYIAGRLETPEDGGYTPVAFMPRKTKAGKDMATMVVVDWLGEMKSVVVFPNNFFLAYDQCRGGVSMKLSLQEKEDGSLIFNGIIR